MASVYIVKRRISDDKITGRERYRHHVKMQLGHDFPIVHLGSWDTPKLARDCRADALAKLARGEMPSRTPALDYQPLNTTVARLADEWLATRVDLQDSTRRNVQGHIDGISERLGKRDPASITLADLRAWISDTVADESLSIIVLRKRIGRLAQILEYAQIEPNPARSRMLKFPRVDDVPKRLPRPSELVKLYAALEPDPNDGRTADRGKNIPVVRLMEQTGVRIHEAVAVRWRDWDPRRKRLLVPKSKTSSGKRLIEQIDGEPFGIFELPPRPAGASDDQHVFPDVTIAGVSSAMRGASKRAGVHGIRPHDLRHLHLSRLLHYGTLSPAPLAARAGHKSPDITLAIYSHVIPPEDDDELDDDAHDDDPRPLT